ncbi:TRAP transporter substrate-binding protein [Reyranella sp. CPCC 100927]|uniref:TRAP transporter substrate-binding protein n=1 Tax=Reyranella sp. CPCC 100927 TaxID=2599616 RepID=UPI001C499924|nr:TRAP transporter substrate-binding protein DctP [Reyranella sp. CPCC 100927]
MGSPIKRRRLIGASAGAVAGSLAAAPAIADSTPAIRWRMASSYPKSLDTVFGEATLIADRVRALTDGKFDIRVFAAGEIVPPLQVLDAVQNGTIECGHSAGFFYIGKQPALVFDTGVPFGLTPRQHNAWMQHGGGLELMREVYAAFNVIQFPTGNTGAQMGGWFRKEIQTPDDLKGLRIRAPGFVGRVYAKLGAVPQTIAGGDIFPALEKGTLDAVEWVGPYDDERLGLHKAAKFYYAPGVLELGASLCWIAGSNAWNALPPLYQQALRSACAEAATATIAKYDANNPPALRRLIAAGAKLSYWPAGVMKAMQKVTYELLDESAGADPLFRKIYESWKAFRDEQHLWFAVNDGAAERFVYANRA